MLQPPSNAALAAGAGFGSPGPERGSKPNGEAQRQNSIILQPSALTSGAAGAPPRPPPRQNGSAATLTVASIGKPPENGGNAPQPRALNAAALSPVPGRKPSSTQQVANLAVNPNAHLPPPYNLPPAAQQQPERKPRMVRKIVKAPEKAERVLYCLNLKNPLRRLCIGIVEWKYPFHSCLIFKNVYYFNI